MPNETVQEDTQRSGATACSQVETFECQRCGHSWKTGQNGSHDCAANLFEQKKELEDEMAMMKRDRPAFLSDTLHRMATELSRLWVIEAWLRSGDLPPKATLFAYAYGPAGFDWGDSPGPDATGEKPLRGKRIRITLEVEDCQPWDFSS